MKKIVPVLLLDSLSIGSFAAYHSKTIKDVKATCSGDPAVRVKTESTVNIAKRRWYVWCL